MILVQKGGGGVQKADQNTLEKNISSSFVCGQEEQSRVMTMRATTSPCVASFM